MVTPFKFDTSIDTKRLERVVNHVIKGGVNYVVALGTTAETPTLKAKERNKVVKTIVKTVDLRVPVIVGVGGNNTSECIEIIQNSNFKGVDGILSVVPYYNKPTQEGLFRHFSEIAKVSKVPIILYNIPSRCGVNMTVDTTIQLASTYSNIVAIKEASGNMEQIKALIARKPQHFQVISGDDSLTVSVIKEGGAGVISVLANAFPKQVSSLVNSCIANDYRKADADFEHLHEMMELLFAEGNPTGIKAMLTVLGICENQLRLPLVPASETLLNRVRTAIRNISLK